MLLRTTRLPKLSMAMLPQKSWSSAALIDCSNFDVRIGYPPRHQAEDIQSTVASSHLILSRQYHVEEGPDLFSDCHLRWSATLRKISQTSTLASKDAARMAYSQDYNGRIPPTEGERSLKHPLLPKY